MPRENTYSAIILKKQPFGEADEIITIFTREAGKLRVLGKSSKLAKSKLQHALQTLFLVNVRLAGRDLPKVIGAEVVNSFSKIRENYDAATMSMYAEELLMKFTPDENKNETLFDLFVDFFTFLDAQSNPGVMQLGLAKFKIDFLDALGLGVHGESGLKLAEHIGFSNSRGSFSDKDSVDSIPVSKQAFELFLRLLQADFFRLSDLATGEEVKELQELLSGFLRYQLERDIRSEGLLGSMV